MNLLVTGAWRCTQEQLAHLADLVHQVYFLQNEKDPLPIPYACVEGVICNGLFLYHHIENFRNLRYIQLTSAGFDRVPMDYVEKQGIQIHNARGVYSIPMAEFAVSGVLQLYKQSRFFYENQKNKKWEKHRNLLELFGKSVCIVGCGSIGTDCSKRFTSFGCSVTGVGRRPRQNDWYEQIVGIEQLDEVLSKADIVVLSLPLTEQSRHLINKDRLGKLKQGAVLVNMARGAIVDSVALTEWLMSGCGAAVLDVFEEEPLAESSALWEMENVILTPHNSFVGDRNQDRMFEMIRSNLGKCSYE